MLTNVLANMVRCRDLFIFEQNRGKQTLITRLLYTASVQPYLAITSANLWPELLPLQYLAWKVRARKGASSTWEWNHYCNIIIKTDARKKHIDIQTMVYKKFYTLIPPSPNFCVISNEISMAVSSFWSMQLLTLTTEELSQHLDAVRYF